MEETISLRELFETLKKRIVMILLITAGAIVASAMISYFLLTPKYQASTQLLVSQQATGASALLGTQFGDDSKYIETYNVIIKSPYILEQVKEQVGLTTNPKVNVSQEGRSQVVTLYVEHTNPATAVEIANVTAAIFQEEVLNLMRIDNVFILSQAELGENPTPVSPNPPLNMAIAFVVGLMTAVGIAFLLEYLDNTIRTEQDVEKHLGIPVLGAIPVIDEDTTIINSSANREKIGSESVGS